jgi:hypothetical protein
MNFKDLICHYLLSSPECLCEVMSWSESKDKACYDNSIYIVNIQGALLYFSIIV